jgi:hypothetical protein
VIYTMKATFLTKAQGWVEGRGRIRPFKYMDLAVLESRNKHMEVGTKAWESTECRMLHIQRMKLCKWNSADERCLDHERKGYTLTTSNIWKPICIRASNMLNNKRKFLRSQSVWNFHSSLSRLKSNKELIDALQTWHYTTL